MEWRTPRHKNDTYATYVGETKRSLKARVGEHRRLRSTTSEVSKHIHTRQPQTAPAQPHTDNPNHTVMLESTKILIVRGT